MDLDKITSMLRNIRILPELPVNYPALDGVYRYVLLKCIHHIEETATLPTAKHIRRWQQAALTIKE